METADAKPLCQTSKVWDHFTFNTAKNRVIFKICKVDLAYHWITLVMH